MIFSSSNRYLSSTAGGLGLSGGQRSLVSSRGGEQTVWEEDSQSNRRRFAYHLVQTPYFTSMETVQRREATHLFLGTNPGLNVSFLTSQFSIKKPKSPLCFLSVLFGKPDLCFQFLFYSYRS